MSRISGFKTVAYGVLIGGIAVLGDADVQAFIAAHIPSIGAMVGTGIVILRALTSSAIFSKAGK